MLSRPSKHLLALAGLLAASVGWGAPSKPTLSGRKVDTLFRSYNGDPAALSRDGGMLAYVVRDERQLAVAVVDLDQREKPRGRILLNERSDAAVTHLEWASPHLLVLVSATPAIFSLDVSTLKSQRVLDSTTFNDPDSTTSRPPRFVGLVPNEPGMAWVEGISQVPGLSQLDMDMAAGGDLSTDQSGQTFDDGNSQTTADPQLDTYNMEIDDVQASQSSVRWVELVKLDLSTGKTKSLSNLSVSLDGTLLYDRQGKPRIMQEQTAQTQHFLTLNPKRSLFSKWLDIDRLLGKGHALEFKVTPENFLAHRSFPLAFDTNPDLFYYASNVGRDTYAIFQLNLKDGSTREITASPDGLDLADPAQPMSEWNMVFDRKTGALLGVRAASPHASTIWTDSDFSAIQEAVRRKFPGRAVELVDGDDARARFLVLVSSLNDPGRYFVYFKATGECLECVRRAPWLKREEANTTRAFRFTSKAGNEVSGRLTLPRATLLNVAPLVVWCGLGPGALDSDEFSRQAQVFADLGCMVLEVDYRGSGGRGVAHRQAITAAFDRIPLEDILAAMDWLPSVRTYDARRVAIGGSGFGGFLALRALALHQGKFRCAVAVNAPTRLDQLAEEPAGERMEDMRRFSDQTQSYMKALSNWKPGQGRMPTMPMMEPRPINFGLELNRWLYSHGATSVKDMSVIADARLINRPILLLHDPDSPSVSFEYPKALKRALGRQGVDCVLKEISGGFAAGNPASLGTAFDAIGEFIADQFYKFDVEVGEAREQK